MHSPRIYRTKDMTLFKTFIFCVNLLIHCEAAKILAVFTAPSISHQVVFRPYTQALAKMGHEVLVVTTDLAFPKGDTPDNLSEIDIHDLLYPVLKSNVPTFQMAEGVSINTQYDAIFKLLNTMGDTFLESEVINKLRGQRFDVLVMEAVNKMILPLSHILQVPVMQISSFGSMFDYETVGAECHPYLYPEVWTQRIHNLTTLEKIHETFVHLLVKRNYYKHGEVFNNLLRNKLTDLPSSKELHNKVSVLLLNVQPIWDENRAVPVGVSYINGIHRWPETSMSEDLSNFFNSSQNGVIFVSLGTNVHPSLLPKDRIQILLDVLSELPQDILLKWDQDTLPDKPTNVKIGKWFPQVAVLNHPKVILFITQCGLQSTEESIDAGVPLIGIPMLFDQWTNAEKVERHGLGQKVEIETMTHKTLRNTINRVIGDERYRTNIKKIRTLMRDQRHNALHLATWWTEYVLRHSGAAHLRAPATNMSLIEYLELELVFIVLTVIVFVFLVAYKLLFLLIFDIFYKRCRKLIVRFINWLYKGHDVF